MDRIHSDTRIGLVKLRVSDIQRSIRFYREVVGLTIAAGVPTREQEGSVVFQEPTGIEIRLKAAR